MRVPSTASPADDISGDSNAYGFSMWENASSPFISFDLNAKAAYLNASAESLLAKARKDVVGSDISVFSELFGPKSLQWLASCPGYVEDSAGRLWLLNTFTYQGGKAFQFQNLTDTDLAVRVRSLEKQVLQLQKTDTLGRLVAGVAHDLNNLFTIVLGYLDVLSLALQNAHRLEIKEMTSACHRAAELVRHLLHFGRKHAVTPQVMSVGSHLKEIVPIVKRLLPETIELIAHISDGEGLVRLSSGHLEQVMLNLVVNARDAMPQGGKLKIESSYQSIEHSTSHAEIPRGRYAVIAVSDTGMGMSIETQASLFQPFFTTKSPDKGSGLGLSTIRDILRESGGYILVTSEVGVGSSFKVFWPLLGEVEAVATDKSGDELPVTGNQTVLLVENDSSVRQVVSRMLQERGFETWEAGSGQEALSLIEDSSRLPDVLITDYLLGGLPSTEMANRLRDRNPLLKVLFISGYPQDMCTGAEVGSFLEKPFNSKELCHKIVDLIC